MCGIVVAHNIDGMPVNNDVLEQFDKQRNRGTQGFGLFDGQEMNIVREVAEDNILKWLVKYDSNLLLFHHRYPTSTDNTKNTAHPFSTKKFFKNSQYILVHNGHISNSRELKLEHEKIGIKYQSITSDGRFNDSEALLWDFALTMEGKQKELKARGGIALVCIRTKKGRPHSIMFARNTNPLHLEHDDTGFRLSSEGRGTMIDADKLHTINFKTNKLVKTDLKVPGYTYSSTAGTGGDYNQGWNYANEEYWNRWKAKKNNNACSQGTHKPTLIEQKGEPGDWLPEHLRKKFAHRLGTGKGTSLAKGETVLEYDENGQPIFVRVEKEYTSFNEYLRDKRRKELKAGTLKKE